MAGRWERLSHHLSLDAPQRRVITVLLTLLISYGVVRLILNPIYINDPQPPAGDLSAKLADRLDPNLATAAELAALPGLGDKRAAAIVNRRETVLKRDPTTVPFHSSDDLYVIPGFARSTIDSLQPYLTFPGDNSARDKDRTAP
ncbi:MAG: Helix-hairpin-helix motif [Phycisphaerales bacterium]|nr:Helix-hairpin-helix motif [Phycisphaerales bacterium]